MSSYGDVTLLHKLFEETGGWISDVKRMFARWGVCDNHLWSMCMYNIFMRVSDRATWKEIMGYRCSQRAVILKMGWIVQARIVYIEIRSMVMVRMLVCMLSLKYILRYARRYNICLEPGWKWCVNHYEHWSIGGQSSAENFPSQQPKTFLSTTLETKCISGGVLCSNSINFMLPYMRPLIQT